MHSILFICPYFGKLPESQFPLWLQSCQYNPTINWLVVTDDRTEYHYPSNVKVEYTTWDMFRQRVQSNFDFPIALNKPYKLCDYKPAYGDIFKEEVIGYDFWGHTDTSDTIYGDLRHFLTEEKLKDAEKVCLLGHFSLYRNTPKRNRRYTLPNKSGIKYEEIFTTDKSRAFDEFCSNSINRIYREYGFNIVEIPDICFDVAPPDKFNHNFTRHILNDTWTCYYPPESHGWIILWEKGKLYAIWRMGWVKLRKKEFGYVHLQKRKMTGTVPDNKSFLAVPNKFVKAPLFITVFHFIYYSYLPHLKQRLIRSWSNKNT